MIFSLTFTTAHTTMKAHTDDGIIKSNHRTSNIQITFLNIVWQFANILMFEQQNIEEGAEAYDCKIPYLGLLLDKIVC